MHEEPEYDQKRLSKASISLMKCLLKKRREDRIAPNMIPKHEWFKSVDFNKILSLEVKAPISPKVVRLFTLE